MQTMKLGKMLLCLALLSAAACSRFVIENEPPVAQVQVIVDNFVFDTKDPIPFAGAPVTITLDSSGSTDDDGTIVRYLWLQTDVPPAERYAGDGMMFAGDPPLGVPSPQLSLGEGKYQYSLWVTDNEGAISEPATVEFTIKTPTTYMPDATCAATYMSDIPECSDCVCTPTAMMGCLDSFTACYQNADPMFVTLCNAIVECGRRNGCFGATCFTPALCETEIRAGITYMGGVDCMGDPAVNPCAAASQLRTCVNPSMMGTCASACN